MVTNEKIPKIDKFDGTNFGFRRMQMEGYFYQKDLYKQLHEKLKDIADDERE